LAVEPDSVFLRACRGLPVERVPVWFMRQAGRYQPEYRALRRTRSLLDITLDPALCAEVTVLPVRQLNVDAAILFSDIMVPLGPAGIEYTLEEHVGPVVARPVRSRADVEAIGRLEPHRHLPHVLETVARARALLGATPLIGFAGAPFTLASYLVDGRPSRHHLATKTLMHAQPALFADLMRRLADIVASHLRAQVEAGAQAVQLFDSWVGSLSPADYDDHVGPVMARLLADLADLGVPRIVFGVETGELLTRMRAAGADVVGVDWRVPMDVASARLGPGVALQGNLDPALMLAPWPEIERAARAALVAGSRHQGGYVFNLGHGVLPETAPETLARLVGLVHAARPPSPAARPPSGAPPSPPSPPSPEHGRRTPGPPAPQVQRR
jgi:uroporphyrinogen decarboxylase